MSRKLRFAGLPAGTINLSDGTNVSGALAVAEPAPPSEDAVLYVRDTTVAAANRVGGNMERGLRNRIMNPFFRVPDRQVLARAVTAVANAGQRIVFGEGAFFDLTDGAMTGGSARVYRIANGVLSLIRTSAIADHAARSWVRMRNASGTSTVITIAPWHRKGATQWLCVRAYNSAGQLGTIGVAAGTWTTPATHKATTLTVPTNPSKTLVEGGVLAAPANVTLTTAPNSESAVTVSWDAVAGAEGYAVYMSDFDPATHRGYYIDLANDGGAAVQVGDMVVLSRQIMNPSRSATITNFVWDASGTPASLGPLDFGRWAPDSANRTWLWRPHDANSPPGATGAYLEITMGSGASGPVRLATFNGTNQTALPAMLPGETYRWEGWIRSDANRTLTWTPGVLGVGQTATISRLNDAPVSLTNSATLNLTTAWQKFSVEWSVNVSVASLPQGVTGPGATLSGAARFDLYDWRLFDVPGVFNGTPELADELAALNLDHIRAHDTIKTFPYSYDLEELIAARDDNLHSSLTNIAAIGTDVWIQPEFHLSDDDFRGLTEYLLAPAGTGQWANLRATLGRTEPWDTAFGRILFELSNETWQQEVGGPAAFYGFPQMTDSATAATLRPRDVYGLWNERAIQIMRARAAEFGKQAVFDAKIVPVIGGWHVQSYGDEAAQRSPSARYVTRAPYVGGWEVGASGLTDSPQSFFEVLFWPGTVVDTELTNSATWVAAAKVNGANANLKAGTYEDAVSFSTLPPNIPVEQLRFAKTKAAGITTLDKIARQSLGGYELQSFFTLQRGEDWAGFQPRTKGNAAYPHTQWIGLWNAWMAGDMKQVAIGRRPTRSATVDNVSYASAAELGVYAVQSGTRWGLLLVNRNLPYSTLPADDPVRLAAPRGVNDTGARSVRLRMPFASAASLTRHAMNGVYDNHNFELPGVHAKALELSITATPLGSWSGPEFTATVPAAEAWLYVFTGAV